MIGGSGNEEELLTRVASVLLQGIADSTAVAVVRVNPDVSAEENCEVTILQYDDRAAGNTGPRPSATLVRQAITRGESLLHLWSGAANSTYTESEGVDWAFCVPVPTDSCPGWGLYVTGSFGGVIPASMTASRAGNVLQDDVKFTEIVATTLGNLRKVRQLERRQTGLRRFFAPVVLDALGASDPDQVLAPREAEIAVMFCDLRGFSRQSEQQSDQLLALLERVSQALGVMTKHILDRGGVIGDFHGDAAMGFWGWPLPQGDAATRACLAGLAVLNDFTNAASSNSTSRLTGFRCGIGIASGRAVAGRIGTIDQVKVTAFGPVVNLASRLESMTKLLRAEVLLDETTADQVRANLPPTVGRVRRLLRVRPAGMTQPLVVSQLLPPAANSPLADEHLLEYEAALDALIEGDWAEAFVRLHRVPPGDRAKDYLTALIAQHDRLPPPDWDGVINLPKG